MVLVAWLLVLLCTAASAQVAVPKLSARVTDLTGTLTAEQRQALETRLAEFEARKGAQIAVLLVPTTQPETIEQYARRVLDEWKLGRKGIDDGALLLVALQDRKLRIETQYGLEGVMPDAIANRIIDEIITPRFKQKDFYGGISAGVERMIGVVEGEPLPPPQAKGGRSGHRGINFESLLMVGFALVFVVAGVLRAMFGRVGGAAITGGIGAVIAWFIVGSLLAAGAVALIVFLLSTVVGVAGLGRSMRRGGYYGGGWGGGGSWGGGGGWSGGGGMGGGGGASGSW
ncbi:MAG: TPM domain-containing protein [Burkholderiales bacterium]